MDTNQKGTWIKVTDRLPKTQGIKMTLTKDKAFGLAAYVDSEWIQFLPTYMGEVHQWVEFVDNGGLEIDFEVDLPLPELDDSA